MDKLKQWVAIAVVAVLAVVAGGWFLLIAPKRSEAADLGNQAAQTEAKNATLAVSLAELKARDKELPKKRAELAAFDRQIPGTVGMPTLIRSFTTMADTSGVELLGITPSPAAPSADKATGTAGTLLDVSVSLQVVGSFAQIQQFEVLIETLPRVLRTTNTVLAPGKNPLTATSDTNPNAAVDGKTIIGTITAHVYVAAPPGSVPAVPGAAAPATPAAASTTTSTKAPAASGATSEK
ncbi:MAG: hypothetical protein JWL64_392 [Frankiales bacterium]|nr:hypothetical protein [Frankiales bacterium]